MFMFNLSLSFSNALIKCNIRSPSSVPFLAINRRKNNEYHDLFETDKKWALFFTPKLESKIFVHSHYETFGWDFRPHITWEPEFATELLISMKQTYTTDDARQLSIAQRKCIFTDEVKLDFYEEEYTFTSCMKV